MLQYLSQKSIHQLLQSHWYSWRSFGPELPLANYAFQLFSMSSSGPLILAGGEESANGQKINTAKSTSVLQLESLGGTWEINTEMSPLPISEGLAWYAGAVYQYWKGFVFWTLDSYFFKDMIKWINQIFHGLHKFTKILVNSRKGWNRKDGGPKSDFSRTRFCDVTSRHCRRR